MWQRFTDRSRRVILYAQEAAAGKGLDEVGTEHLLLGLIRDENMMGARVLALNLGVDLARLRQGLESRSLRGEGVGLERAVPSDAEAATNFALGERRLAPAAKRAIDVACEEAKLLGDNYIGTEHLLLGLLGEPEGLAHQALAEAGVTLERARREVLALREGRGVAPAERRCAPAPPRAPCPPGARIEAKAAALAIAAFLAGLWWGRRR